MSVARDVNKAKPAFLAVDFFCGAGGTTRGLIDAGGYVIAGIDKDARCRSTYVDNNYNETVDYTPARFLQYDIFPATEDYPEGRQEELATELDGLVGYYRRKAKGVPLLFAICAPCQPFTRLARKELSERRKKGREKDSNLLREAAGFVERFRPEMVLSENVSGIGDARYGGVWDEFRTNLEALGYVTGSQIVCTSKFGVPQYRKRSILVAVRRELARPENIADLMGRELLVPEADPEATVVSVARAIGHLPPIVAGGNASGDPEPPRALAERTEPEAALIGATGPVERLHVLDRARRPQPRVPPARQRSPGRSLLLGRVHAHAAGAAVADDHDQVPLDLERPVRALRREPGAGHFAPGGRHPAVLPGGLRFSIRRIRSSPWRA